MEFVGFNGILTVILNLILWGSNAVLTIMLGLLTLIFWTPVNVSEVSDHFFMVSTCGLVLVFLFCLVTAFTWFEDRKTLVSFNAMLTAMLGFLNLILWGPNTMLTVMLELLNLKFWDPIKFFSGLSFGIFNLILFGSINFSADQWNVDPEELNESPHIEWLGFFQDLSDERKMLYAILLLLSSFFFTIFNMIILYQIVIDAFKSFLLHVVILYKEKKSGSEGNWTRIFF